MFRALLSRVSSRAACSSSSADYTRWSSICAVAGAGAAVAAATGVQATADYEQEAIEGLPVAKLACHRDVAPPRTPAVLVSCGSFNPPTVMHLRMFDLATAALAKQGYDVWGCYMSPVADAYGKKGLAHVHDRLQLCELAAADTNNVMVDSWEAQQPGYTRTLQVLRHIRRALEGYLNLQELDTETSARKDAAGLAAAAPADRPAATVNTGALLAPMLQPITGSSSSSSTAKPHDSSSSSSSGSSHVSSGGGSSSSVVADNTPAAVQVPKVMLLCGADLLATVAQPGVWKDPDIILQDHGIVCICRTGTDIEQLLRQPGSLLNEHRDNIIVVEEPVANGVSSTQVRGLLAANEPVRYLVPDAVISYIKQYGLYGSTKNWLLASVL